PQHEGLSSDRLIAPIHLLFSVILRPPCSTLFPYTTLFRSLLQSTTISPPARGHPDSGDGSVRRGAHFAVRRSSPRQRRRRRERQDRKSTRLNSSHLVISYAVFCLKKTTTTCLLVHLLRTDA